MDNSRTISERKTDLRCSTTSGPEELLHPEISQREFLVVSRDEEELLLPPLVIAGVPLNYGLAWPNLEIKLPRVWLRIFEQDE